MSEYILRTPALIYLIGLSFFGLFLAGMLSIYLPVTREDVVWRKPLIGSVFSLICILGILAVFLPSQCSGIFEFLTRGKREHSAVDRVGSHGASSIRKGHHPNCEGFSSHVFRIGNRTLCTACTGLFFGGLTSLVGSVLYFFGDSRIGLSSPVLVWIGLLGVGAGFFQFKAARTAIRLSLNTFFVFGTFLILVAVDELAQNVFADTFVVLLAIFWLFTRISLSQWDHKRICYICRDPTCEAVERRKKGASYLRPYL